MSVWLKQSTAVTLTFGPFVSDVDGATPNTGLTIAQADTRLSKNDGTFAQKNESSSATHKEAGYYSVALDTTDTNTLGVLVVAVNKGGALPVWQNLMVVSANVWDSLFGADQLLVEVDAVSSGTLDAIADAVLDEALVEPVTVFAWGAATLRNVLAWLGALARNKTTQTATVTTLRNADDDATIATSDVDDDGTTFTRDEWT